MESEANPPPFIGDFPTFFPAVPLSVEHQKCGTQHLMDACYSFTAVKRSCFTARFSFLLPSSIIVFYLLNIFMSDKM
jgi:hypothetical protein